MINHEQLKAFHAGVLQGKAYRALQADLTIALSPFNLSIPEWKILGFICEEPGIRGVDLAGKLAIDTPLVTVLLQNLKKKKYIKREKDSHDKRVMKISCTEIAEDTIEKVEVAVRKTMKNIFVGVQPEEMQTYIRVLSIIAKNSKSEILNKKYLSD